MTEGRRLKLVASEGEPTGQSTSGGKTARELDWTILMARAQDGDTVAYQRLLEEIAPWLRSLVRRWHKDPWDIEDTVQDILLTLHAIRHTYDPTRPFGPWLMGIANRRAVDRLRRRGRQTGREVPLTVDYEAATGQDDDILEKRHLAEAMGSLPSVQRTAVDLLKLKEMSLREASDASGLSIASLKMATHRALKTLRGLLLDGRDG